MGKEYFDQENLDIIKYVTTAFRRPCCYRLSQTSIHKGSDQLALCRPIMRLHHTADDKPAILQENVGNPILFLCLGVSRNINGVIVPVDNGWSAC